jgi:hypothetical protein
VREICAEGDKTILVTREEAVEYALEKIENGCSIAVKLGDAQARIVEPEILKAEILTSKEELEVLVIPPVVGG